MMMMVMLLGLIVLIGDGGQCWLVVDGGWWLTADGWWVVDGDGGCSYELHVVVGCLFIYR